MALKGPFLLLALLFLHTALAKPKCFPPQSIPAPDHDHCYHITVDDIILAPRARPIYSFVSGPPVGDPSHGDPSQYKLPRTFRNSKYPDCEVEIDTHRMNQPETIEYQDIARTVLRIINTCMLGRFGNEKAGQDDVLSGGNVFIKVMRAPATRHFQSTSLYNATHTLEDTSQTQ